MSQDPEETAATDRFVARSCPLCDSSERAAMVVSPPITPASISPEECAEYWRGFRRKACFFPYHRCNECRMLFCRDYFVERELSKLYSAMPDNTAGASTAVLAKTQEGYVDFLAQHAAISGTYLEIGPDIGLSVAAAKKRGSVDQVVLVEPNEAVHQELLASAEGIGVKRIVSDLSECSSPVGADVAILIHVLDHLRDPREHLYELSRHLKDGATILVVVHNEGSFLRRILGVRWPPFTLQHPQLFTPRTLEGMLNAAGFAVEAVQPTWNYFPVRHIAEVATAILGLPKAWAHILPERELKVRLGNIMAIGRK